MTKKKKIIFCIFAVIYYGIAISICLSCINRLKPTIVTKDDISIYNTSKYDNSHAIFPRRLNAKVINDYYYMKSNWYEEECKILDVTYDDVCFENEMERLQNIIHLNYYYSENRPSDYGRYKKLMYCDDGVLFNLPTYVAEYNNCGCYNYVCIDYENKRCVYVFLEWMELDKFPLDDKFLPINYLKDDYEYTIGSMYPDVSFSDWYK